MKLIRWLNEHLPASVYLGVSIGIIRFLSRFSLNNQWMKFVKHVTSSERSPMWASEFYQVTSLAIGFALLGLLPSGASAIGKLRWIVLAAAAYRILDILFFGLHWVMVDRRPIKDFRRSLIAFILNLIELAIFGSLLVDYMPGTFISSRWMLFYTFLGSIFSISLPKVLLTPSVPVAIVTHVVIAVSWLLLLIILAVVLSGIVREEIGGQGPEA